MSTLKVNTLTDTAATKSVPIADVVNGVARAWVNFDGTTNTGGNCDIRASYNVTDVDDNGAGNYTVNFTTAMPDANYAAVVIGSIASGGGASGGYATEKLTTTTTLARTASGFSVFTLNSGGSSFVDHLSVNVSIFR